MLKCILIPFLAQDCFDTTDWDVLCEPHGDDIDSLTTCITDCINFCMENTVPTRKVWCFPNNKPWVTPELKAQLKEKKRVFKSGAKEELRRVQKGLKRGIRRGKDSYRRKLGKCLTGNNTREVWKGLKTISSHTKDSGRGPESGDHDWTKLICFLTDLIVPHLPPPPTRAQTLLCCHTTTPPLPPVLLCHPYASPPPSTPCLINPHTPPPTSLNMSHSMVPPTPPAST